MHPDASKIISFVAQLIVSSKVRRVNKNVLFAEAPRCSRSHIRGSIPEWIGKRIRFGKLLPEGDSFFCFEFCTQKSGGKVNKKRDLSDKSIEKFLWGKCGIALGCA